MKYRFLLAIMVLAVLGTECTCSDTFFSRSSKPRELEAGDAAGRMQAFVKDISAYARGQKRGFIIIPQNAEELAFNNADPNRGIMSSYISAIDGIGTEELFYNDRASRINDSRRLKILNELKKSVKIMVSDYVPDDNAFKESIDLNQKQGFIAFPRSKNNYDYKYIPTSITDANKSDITELANAKNYLYLIGADNKTYSNKDAFITSIQNTAFDVVIIDLFAFGTAFTKTDISRLKAKAGGGSRLVICYISIGSAENYRYYWKQGWKKGNPSWIKKSYPGYPDEYWVEYWHPEWRSIIFGNDNSYIKKIIDAGFDGAYLDNVEAYEHL